VKWLTALLGYLNILSDPFSVFSPTSIIFLGHIIFEGISPLATSFCHLWPVVFQRMSDKTFSIHR